MQQPEITDSLFTDGVRPVKIHRHVLELISDHEKKRSKKESGGILLGSVYKKYDEIIALTAPNPKDKKGFFSFLRKKEPAQIEINKAWDKSGGYTIYLGEWHTHPDHTPLPSTQDKTMILSSVKKTKMEIDYLYLIIAGRNNSFWVGRQTCNALTQLFII